MKYLIVVLIMIFVGIILYEGRKLVKKNVERINSFFSINDNRHGFEYSASIQYTSNKSIEITESRLQADIRNAEIKPGIGHVYLF